MSLKLSSDILPTEEPVKKKKEKIEEGEDLAQILTAIRKEKGANVVITANHIPLVRRLPTGLFELDFYLGGGFPCGRYSIIYGPESSNKTNIALKAVASAQKLPPPCNKAVWVNIEQTFDPIWAAKLGVNLDELLIVNAGYGEEAVDLIDALVRASDVAILVVDSIAALVPSKEIAQSSENYDIGLSALLIKRTVNKLMYAFGTEIKRGHDPCVLLINQIRFKPGVMFGDPETMPGGEAQKFLSSLRIRTYSKNLIDKDTNQIMFKETHVVVKKAKVLVRAASFDFKLCVHTDGPVGIGETDSFQMVKGLLQSLEMIVKTSKGYSIVKGGFSQSDVWPTLTAMQDEYLSNPLFCKRLQKLVLDSNNQGMLVEDPDAYTPKEVDLGIAIPGVGTI